MLHGPIATLRMLVCCVALLGAARAQAADAHRPGLNWVRLEGAERCLSSAQLAERVEARVGRVLFASASEADFFVDGYVRRASTRGWDVVLEVSERDGRVLGKRDMHFDGEACATIDEGVTLVIAVTLYPNTGLVDAGIPLDKSTAGSLDRLFGNEPTDPDPAGLPSGVKPEAKKPRSASAPARGNAPPASPNAAPDSDKQRFGLAFDAAGTAGFGQLPGPGLGLVAHVQLTPPGAWPIELGAAAFLDRTAKASGGVAGQASFGLLLGSVSICPWQPAWLAALAFCAGAEVGRLHVAPTAFAVLQPKANDFVANLLGSAVLRARLAGGLYLRAALLLALPLIQRRYEYQTPQATTAELYRMPQVAGRAEIGLGWRF